MCQIITFLILNSDNIENSILNIGEQGLEYWRVGGGQDLEFWGVGDGGKGDQIPSRHMKSY